MQNIQPNSDFFCSTAIADAPFAWFRGRVISRGQFWADVRKLAERLPDRPYLFNLCENRYLFCVCLLAALSRRQVCLLPPGSQMAVIEEIALDYPGAYLASEQLPQATGLEWFEVTAPDAGSDYREVEFNFQATAVIAFTSGSTGRPKPCRHSLETFKCSAMMAMTSLRLTGLQRLVVSTTPPQHMFGLETSVFWPLFSALILHDGRPFFGEDIRQTVAGAPWLSLLVSTPTHLRSLLNVAGDWSRLDGIISATDSLSEQLAGEVVRVLGQSPREIYGSTETLSFACRETLRETLWVPYAGCSLSQMGEQTLLDSPHLPDGELLQDDLDLRPDGRFAVLGRLSDMVKIGGKRASLTDLNRRLRDIAGVVDGFCYVQENGRLAAVVVGHLDKQAVRNGLQPYIDELFLPRKVHFVPAIQRSGSGKLLKAEMDRLLLELDGSGSKESSCFVEGLSQRR